MISRNEILAKEVPDTLIVPFLASGRISLPKLYMITNFFCRLYDLLLHIPLTHEDIEAMNLTNLWNTTKCEVLKLKGPADV
jgi:hypothetical protein